MARDTHKKLRRLPSRNNKNGATRILYVEDAEVIYNAIAMLLELNGYKVAYARNGQEGIEKALRWQPDLVLMDLRMPVMDGYTAIKKIKVNPRTSRIPVFVVSAWSGKQEYTKAKLAGADKYFVKPPDLEMLIEAIEETVTGAARSRRPYLPH